MKPRSRKLKKKDYEILTENNTVEPRFDEPLFNEVLGITNEFV